MGVMDILVVAFLDEWHRIHVLRVDFVLGVVFAMLERIVRLQGMSD